MTTIIATSLRELNVSSTEKLIAGDIDRLSTRHFQQIHECSDDLGLALLNPRTGGISLWVIVRTLKDPGDAEVAGWVLNPTTNTVGRFPYLRGWSMTIMNVCQKH